MEIGGLFIYLIFFLVYFDLLYEHNSFLFPRVPQLVYDATLSRSNGKMDPVPVQS